jgi:hypothetical protein
MVVSMVVVSSALAHGDGDANWDGTYERASGGGYAFCPDATAPVVVTNGKFSIPWMAKLPKLVRLGTIEGSVRPSGLAVFKATITEPMPADVKAALDGDGDNVEDVKALAGEMKLSFGGHGGRTINLSAGTCYASWTSGPAKAKQDGGAAKRPSPVAAGSPSWDTSYQMTSHSAASWWCPRADAFETVTVTKGRVSIPWRAESRDYGDIELGQIDGSIAASGSVKLRPWMAVSELPPELAAGRPDKEATLSFVTAIAPKMTFFRHGGVRGAHLAFGKTCEYELESDDRVVEKKTAAPSAPPAKTTSSPPATSSKSSGGSSSGSTRTTSSPPSRPPPPPAPKKGKGNGAECTYSSDCASDHCDFHKCTSGGSAKALGNGMACDFSSDCASGECTFHKCASRGSKKDLASGADCVYSSDCASGSCTYKKCQ